MIVIGHAAAGGGHSAARSSIIITFRRSIPIYRQSGTITPGSFHLRVPYTRSVQRASARRPWFFFFVLGSYLSVCIGAILRLARGLDPQPDLVSGPDPTSYIYSAAM
jgi:hypothetical protein